ncbi:hypothetical protein MGYG_06105 [Nannizzia gypsea CBS 118893]|uniref:Dickkopf N-terminal cysteine-rich domain-containing protein n=1 Tax=Arthroderma gypseum (strain ATCC MYA-4604 / CBS 118893) TaxID=535722 RepID=E4V0H3_ARTGP|nr:hypothetical protein MGYG_06105 [Nannizzia gypsea CBS 118893]EFR03110.1 hypothetical protein MGYG_06105 [Nannizzia gypsea CBS 118893]
MGDGGRCGVVTFLGKDNLGLTTTKTNLGQCGPDEYCLDSYCKKKIPRGGHCEATDHCFASDYCAPDNTCQLKLKRNGTCSKDSQCQGNICAKGMCQNSACGSNEDCKKGKICAYPTDNWLPTVEKAIRTCRSRGDAVFGRTCKTDQNCEWCPLEGKIARTMKLRKDLKKLYKALGKAITEEEVEKALPLPTGPPCKRQRKCQLGVCVENNWFRNGKATTGFVCRSDEDCASGNCEVSTHKDGKITLRYCGRRKTSTSRR